MTAAHCIPGAKGFPEPDTELRLIFNRVDDQDPIVEVIAQDQFEQIIVNAEFGTMPNRDLAVIVLKAPYTKAPTVKLPQLGQRPAIGEVITASGWGYTNNPDDPSMLRKVDIPVVPCPSGDPTLCAGAPGMGVYPGDSGGPGFRLSPDGTVTQYGVVTGVGVNDDDLMVSGYTDLSSSEAWQAMREALVSAGLPHLIP